MLCILLVIFQLSTSPRALIFIWKSSIQLILLMGSLVSIREMRVLMKGDVCPGNCSSLLLSTSMRLAMELDWKGHIPKIISQMTTPSDQISALLEYISPLSTSGAMQMGEPSMVLVISSAEFRFLQKPKSPSFITPLWKKMLSGFMSLCMMLYLLRIWNASRSCLKMSRAPDSASLPCLARRFSRVPPLQYSQMKQKLLEVFSMSQYLIILACASILDRMLISLTVHYSSFLFYLNLLIGMTLIAYSFLSVLLIARQTLPQTPEPICSQSTQFYMYFTILFKYYNPTPPLNSYSLIHQDNIKIQSLGGFHADETALNIKAYIAQFAHYSNYLFFHLLRPQSGQCPFVVDVVFFFPDWQFLAPVGGQLFEAFLFSHIDGRVNRHGLLQMCKLLSEVDEDQLQIANGGHATDDRCSHESLESDRLAKLLIYNV